MNIKDLDELIEAQREQIDLTLRDKLIYGVGIFKHNTDGSVKHVPYLDWLNMNEDEKCETIEFKL